LQPHIRAFLQLRRSEHDVEKNPYDDENYYSYNELSIIHDYSTDVAYPPNVVPEAEDPDVVESI